jgi:hypothetical protein
VVLSRLIQFSTTPFCKFLSFHVLGVLLIFAHSLSMDAVYEVVSKSPQESLLGSQSILWGYFFVSLLLLIWLFYKMVDFFFRKPI